MTAKRPTDPNIFLEKTCLILDCLLQQIRDADPDDLAPDAVEWFLRHCNLRIRWFHANNRKWRAWLEGEHKRIDPREQCKVWMRHWLAAYRQNPEDYRSRHDMETVNV
jgi:hypothetical protein